uniref:Uncharacterized protein n=1 Tax=Octopus bimaculoides TaxID=37653 RepID=A0A0L8I388_OCTBM
MIDSNQKPSYNFCQIKFENVTVVAHKYSQHLPSLSLSLLTIIILFLISCFFIPFTLFHKQSHS